MNDRRRIFAGAATLSLAQVAEQACVFVRNLVLARLLGPDNMGVAATFAVTLAVLEMSSNLAADRLLLQAKDGDDPALQDAAHVVELIRGLAVAAAVFALAGPIATLFKVPEATWAYRALALAPLSRGLLHLDSRRLVRDHRYLPMVLVDTGSQVLMTLAAWPLARALGDYWAVLWLVVGQVAAQVAISHAVARRPYRLGITRAAWTRIHAFGWPLLINGLLLFGVFQGDRLIIGVFYDMTTLGVYSVAFSLAMMPTMMLARVATPTMLPALARATDQPAQFQRRYDVSHQTLVMMSVAYLAVLVGGGGALMAALYGEAYRSAGAFIGVLGLMQSVRMVRIAPTLGAMAHGDTRNSMIANIWRTGAILPAVLAAAAGVPVVVIAAVGVAGELAAWTVSTLRFSRRQGTPLRSALPALGLLAGVLAGLGAMAFSDTFAFPYLGERWSDWGAVAVAVLSGAVAAGAMGAAMPAVRAEALRAAARVRRRGAIAVDTV